MDVDEITILLVEDEPLVALKISSLLKKLGYTVDSVYSAGQALEVFHHNPADLILMDIDLGIEQIDGIAAAKEILHNYDVPLLFLSGRTDFETVRRTEDIPAYGFLAKNSNPAVIDATLKTAIRLFRANRQYPMGDQIGVNLSYLSTPGPGQDAGPSFREGTGNIQALFLDAEGVFIFLDSDRNISGIGCCGTTEYESDEFIYEGIRYGDLCEKPVRDALPLGLGEEINRNIDQLTKSVRSRIFESRITSSGKQFVFECCIIADGERRYIIIIKNITDQKNSVFIRTLSEHVVNNIQLGLYIYHLEDIDDDSSLRLVFANAEAVKITGIPIDECIGNTIDEVFPNARSRGLPKIYADVARTGEPAVLDDFPYYDHRVKEGYYSVKVFPLPGRFIGAAFENISENKEIARALQRSERRYKNIFQNSFVSIWEEDISNLRHAIGELKEQGVSDFNAYFRDNPGEVERLVRLIDIVSVNEITLEWYGVDTKEELVSLYRESLNDEALERSRRELTAIAEGKRFLTGESTALKSDGAEINFIFHITIPPEEIPDEMMIVVLTDVSKLKELLQEKETLMNELNHRVKNNLILVSSLISLKNNAIGNAADLSDLENRINAISFLHERLYRTDSFDAVKIDEYLEQIAKTVLSTFSDTPVKLITKIAPFELGAKDALSLGLIINELATNAIKHGYTGIDQPEFNIELKHTQDDPPCRLVLTNNGHPISDDFDIDNPGSLGIRLIKELVNGLGGTIEIIREPHPVFTISF